jgi:hypothetical protein
LSASNNQPKDLERRWELLEWVLSSPAVKNFHDWPIAMAKAHEALFVPWPDMPPRKLKKEKKK